MTDYKTVCTVADVEDYGVNTYSGTIVIDGVTRSWFATDDTDRRYYRGRLKVDGVSIRKRKDYLAIHETVNQAIRYTVQLMYPPQPPQPSEPELDLEALGGGQAIEDDGLTMEDVLGPANGGQP